MPYANIHYIKLQIELLNDKRFIFDCDQEQKWLYIGLLLLAGDTKNCTSSDENYLKNRLNIDLSPEKVKENVKHLASIFPKMVCKGGYVKFKKFNELHNYLEPKKRKPEGTPKELQRVMQSIVEYIIVKKSIVVDEKNPYLKQHVFKRYIKSAKELALLTNCNEELAKKAIDWVSGWCGEKNFNWELETVIKHYINGKSCNFNKAPKKEYKTTL